MTALIDAPLARLLLEYDEACGRFWWRERSPEMFAQGGVQTPVHLAKRWNTRFAGKEAFGSTDSRGYRQTRIFNNTYTAHRVAFLIMVGRYPKQIDHINQDRADCRWENLREVDNRENCTNRTMQSNNTSGHTGVYWTDNVGKWCAAIKVNGKTITLGYFSDIQEAVSARKNANIRFNFHENHGRKVCVK